MGGEGGLLLWGKFQGRTTPKRTRRECPKLRNVEDRKKNRGKSRAGRRDLTTASGRPERKRLRRCRIPTFRTPTGAVLFQAARSRRSALLVRRRGPGTRCQYSLVAEGRERPMRGRQQPFEIFQRLRGEKAWNWALLYYRVLDHFRTKVRHFRQESQKTT